MQALKSKIERVRSWWAKDRDIKGTLVDLAREFAIPAIVALMAVFAGATSTTFRDFQQYFLGFFAIAWLTGQYVRVGRERQRRSDVRSTERRLQNLNEKLEQQLEAIIGFATGGDSRCEVTVQLLQRHDKNELEFTMRNTTTASLAN